MTRECVAEAWVLERQQTAQGGQTTAAVTRVSQLTSLFVVERLYSFQYCTDVPVTDH
jgi:hypothetical protein